MRDLLETFATLSGLRDRLTLKTALARLVHDVVQPDAVATWRRVADEGVEQWMLVHRIAPGNAAAGPSRLERLPVAAPAWQGIDDQAHLGCPATRWHALRCGTAVVGALEVTTHAPLDEVRLRQVRAVVRFFGNLRSLIEENECDALTGLLNRKTFDESFARIAFAADAVPAADASREAAGAHWSLGVIDIDHFKRINDGFGHLIGDEVLLMLSQRMRATLRTDDQIYRFGGEEFVVLLRTRDPADAPVAFERIRQAVEAQEFPQVGHITISVGCTGVQPGDTPNDAFGRADQAVYWVKQHGRNQVRVFDELVAGGEIALAEAASGVEFF
jgi:diguanylate cyclase (GGDEF)-like protein